MLPVIIIKNIRHTFPISIAVTNILYSLLPMLTAMNATHWLDHWTDPHITKPLTGGLGLQAYLWAIYISLGFKLYGIGFRKPRCQIMFPHHRFTSSQRSDSGIPKRIGTCMGVMNGVNRQLNATGRRCSDSYYSLKRPLTDVLAINLPKGSNQPAGRSVHCVRVRHSKRGVPSLRRRVPCKYFNDPRLVVEGVDTL